ncbi:BTAD domain-containing putative transcriptional regulator [Dactylosporangium sp. NPDC051541]|uniref:AfsR/SARP family transcriptional regulator n=1 Tax=Dactylosporangium sp. NPDC051541 TaxID=3363977 RepID=UPI00379B286E
MVVEWRVLGPFELVVDGRPVHLGGPKIRGVMARLGIVAGQTVSVSALVSELWGERAPADAHRTVRTYISRLRRAFVRRGVAAEGFLLTRPSGYEVRVDPMLYDAARFQRLVAEGRRESDPEAAAGRLGAALALWRGDALAEFAELPALAAEGLRLDRLRLAAVEDRIDALLRAGYGADVVGELESLVVLNPTRERLWGQLMTALYRTGRQAEALAAFRTARGLLIGEYGVEPSPWLSEVHRRVLRQAA